MNSILIVEDENIIALDIKFTLKKLGYQIMAIVPSGEMALEKIRLDKPDLVLMDINLRGNLTGIETARLIREEFGIPIIFLSAFKSFNNIIGENLLNAAGHLSKPFHEKDLHAAILKALS